MSAVGIQISQDYAVVLAIATATGFLTTWQGILVGGARKAAGIAYPLAYASLEQQANDPKAKVFNCCQRAHANTIENLPYILFTLLFSGLEHPRVAAGLGATWVVGRVFYTLGYRTGNPKNRQWGVFSSIAGLGLLLTSAYTAFNLIRA